jgi:tryptophan-rich sensory protein
MKRLVLWLVAAFVPAFIGAPFAGPRYYATLRKPTWAPPPGVFGPVWTILYALIGVAAWRVASRSPNRAALRLWGVQLLLNAAWTPIFFGLRRPGVALAEIVAMWVAIAATTVVFLRRHVAAGVLMLPYLAWVTFAATLNFAIWRRNR